MRRYAPVTTLCVTELHQMRFGKTGLGLHAVNYVGTLETRLDWFGRSLVLRCHIQGSTGACELVGDLPPPGVTVLHNCRSEETASGLPGGSGLWRCWFLNSPR